LKQGEPSGWKMMANQGPWMAAGEETKHTWNFRCGTFDLKTGGKGIVLESRAIVPMLISRK